MSWLVLLLLAQPTLGGAQAVTITNPSNPAKRVTTTTSGGKELLDVNCPGCSGGASASRVGIDVMDGGILQYQLQDIDNTLALIKAKTDNLDVTLSTRTKPADQQHIIIDSSASIAVTGPLTDVQLRATPVPVSGTVTTSPPANASTNIAQVNGVTVNIGTGTANTGTQRVAVASDSSITANAGTNLNTSALALDATLTGRTQKTQITDGTRDGTVKAGSTAAQAADTSVVVALSPNSPIPAGTAVIGHVITDATSTTAVSGNVTVVQPTGTNLHAVLDATSTTAVTQATGTNLHAVLDATSTTTVTQATGTNLHAVLDSTSTTAVTQATASNLNAQVQGPAASGATKSGNPVQVGHVFNTTQPTVTNGQVVEAQGTARGAMIVATGADTFTVAVSSVGGTVTIAGTTTDSNSTVASANSDGAAVSVTAASVTCLASNVSRQGCAICLDIDATANVHVRFSSSAATTSFQKLTPGQCAYCNSGNRVYTGTVTCISASGTQTAYATELN
jgi:hypothetical protein